MAETFINFELRDRKTTDELLAGIIARGNVARFHCRATGAIKHVTDIAQDADGDMKAAWSNGGPWVCTYAASYEISELTPAEAEAERGEAKPMARPGTADSGPAICLRLGGDGSTY